MAVYEGVLGKMSAGFTHEGRGVKSGRGNREFIEIGAEHLRNVRLENYQDTLLQDAVGEDVAVSVVGRQRPSGDKPKWVMAVQTPGRGVVRIGGASLSGELIWKTLKSWIIALIIGGIVLAIGRSSSALTLIGGAIIFLGVFGPLVYDVMVLRAWGALEGRPALAAAETSHALVADARPAEAATKTCPQCAEEVKSAAVVCRYCAHSFA